MLDSSFSHSVKPTPTHYIVGAEGRGRPVRIGLVRIAMPYVLKVTALSNLVANQEVEVIARDYPKAADATIDVDFRRA